MFHREKNHKSLTQDFDLTMRFIKQKLLASYVIHEENVFTLFTQFMKGNILQKFMLLGLFLRLAF